MIYAGSFLFAKMRYYYEPPEYNTSMYGEIYICNHPVYNRCTLFRIREKGLAVVQQRYRESDKSTYWTEIDRYLVDRLYLHPNFKKFFDERADVENDGIFPTVSVRQIMWGLKMKPLKRERWETLFDRRII